MLCFPSHLEVTHMENPLFLVAEFARIRTFSTELLNSCEFSYGEEPLTSRSAVLQ